MGDHTQAVVFEVPEAIGAALDELHLAVESFGDPVVAHEPPHARDRFPPLFQRVGQRLQRRGLVLPQRLDRCQQPADVAFALPFGLVLVVHEFPEAVHFSVKGLEDRVGGEELFEAGALPLIEPFRSLAHGGEVATVVLQVGHQQPRQRHEVVLDDPHDMEPVGNDAGVGEVTPDEAAVGAGEVDADDLHPLPPLEFVQESGQVRLALPWLDLEDPAPLQIAEGGAEALALVQGVLIDAEVARAVQREAFGGLADGELVVDAGDGGLAEFPAAGEDAGADAIMMMLINLFPERLGAVASGQDAGEPWQEGLATGSAEEAVGMDDEPGCLLETIEVADLALVAAFAEELGALAVWTAFRSPGACLKLDMDGGGGRLVALEGVVTLQAYI